MSIFIGIDVGGTSSKGLALDGNGKILAENSVDTVTGDGLADCIDALIEKLVLGAGGVYSDVAGVGVGCPGIIDSESGTVIFAANLLLNDYPLGKLLKSKTGLNIKIVNDANAAALGEARFGAGKGTEDSLFITLGTGVGGGVVIGGKLFEGFKSAGAEIGHMVIERNGNKCTCGRRGCFEAYCSARALTKRTRDAMEDDTASAMWKTYTYANCNGATAFEYMDSDVAARKVVDWYLEHLTCGITNLCNIFRPQRVLLGGGVAAQGTRLTAPLQKMVDKEIFGGTDYAPVDIVCASLGNRAGAYGAAALFMK